MVPNQLQGQRRSGYTTTQQIAYARERHATGSKVPILAVLSSILGIESFLYAANLKYNPNLTQLNELHTMLGSISSSMPYVLGLTGVIALVASFGYLRRMSWAWLVGVVSALLSAFTIVAPNLIGFLLGVACLGMLLVPSVRSSLRH